MEIKEIIDAYGAYYLNAGQNKKRILLMLTTGAETPKFMTKIKTNDTIYRLSQASINSIVQPFRKGWHPKGNPEFIPNEIKLFKMKVDSDISPDEIEDTWLGFLSGQGLARKDWPLVKYVIENLYIPQIHEDMELNAYFNGEYKAPQDGVEPTVADSMDGLKIQLQRGVDATSNAMNLIKDIGELDAATIFDQIEAFDDAIGKSLNGRYENIKMNVFISPAMHKAYLRDKRTQGYYDMRSDKDINSGIDFSPRQVVSLPSMIGYKNLFATPPGNILHLTKREADKTLIKIEESKREVSLMCDWWEGVGFGCNKTTWTTQPKTAVPA